MPERVTKRVRGLAAAAVAAVLAFGAAQAFAAPAAAETGPWCTPRSCAAECAPFDGYCNFSNGICYCAG